MTSQYQSLGGGGAAGKNPVIRSYTSSSSYTPPTSANFYGIEIICLGAGGGGGSGRTGAANTNRLAGQGGTGGALVRRFMQAAELPAGTYQITIGAGGTGGPAITTTDTNGTVGSAGGPTVFAGQSNLVVAPGGLGGRAGNNTSSIIQTYAEPVVNAFPNYSPYAIAGADSLGVTATVGGNLGAAALAGCGGASGGGGGVITSGNIMRDARGALGVIDRGTTVAATTASASDSNQPGADGTDGSAYWSGNYGSPLPVSIGSGGAGGGCGSITNAGAGGQGGKGAGGGGGGAALNPYFSGAGGNGGAGLCVIIEYFGA